MPSPAARALMLAVARDLEYGDYLLHPGIAACNQRSHRLIKAYRTDLRWMIVGIDEGGFVHTEEFHRDSVEDSAKAAVYERLFLDLDRALQDGDYARCAEIATLSAELHDDKLPKKSLADLRQVRSQTGALGICVAHSGTVAGLIYSRHQPDAQERIAQARALLADMEYQSLLYTLKEAPARGQRSPVV
jgi:L-threonine kinase